MKLFLPLLFFVTFGSLLGQAPSNDACAGSTSLPQNGTCLTGTTLNSTDNWAGTVGCQSGNHPEVWYTFTSSGTLGQFTVTNGTQGGNIEFILLSATGSCTGLGVVNSTCGASPLSVSSTLQPGTTYYVTVSSSTSANGTFNICLTTTTPPPTPGQDCTNSAILCTNSSFSQGTFTGIGTVEDVATNTCFGTSNERQSKWYKFTAGCSGTFGLDIVPTTSTNDYDFAFWNTTAGCYTSGFQLGSALACNWSATSGPTGLSSTGNTGTVTPNPCSTVGATDCATGGGPNSGCQACTYQSTVVNLVAGNVYSFLIDNFSSSGAGFNISFNGSATMGPDAGFTFTYSGASNCTVNTTKTCAISPTTNSTYLWTWGDGTSSTTMNASHTYAATGTYIITYKVTDLLGCSRTTSQTVTPCLIALPIELLSFAAKDGGDGTINLNWTTATEKDIEYYTIERSIDANNFTWIGNLDSKSIDGSSNSYLSYSFVDADAPLNQEVYYRLSHVNRLNGEKISVGITSVVAAGEIGGLQLIPNPANNEVQMNFYSYANAVGEYVIYDFSGKPVVQNSVSCLRGVNGITTDLSEIPSGFYIVTLKVGDKSYQSKLIKN